MQGKKFKSNYVYLQKLVMSKRGREFITVKQ